MAHSLSAKKRVRQNARRRLRNRTRRSELKSTTRRVLGVVESGNVENAQQAVRSLYKLMDRAAARRTVHRNAAARRKSRMARRLNAITSTASAK